MTLTSTTETTATSNSYPVLYLAAGLTTYTFGAANLIVPLYAGQQALGSAAQSFVLTIYTTVLSATLILGGRLGDRFGRRRMLAIGLVVFAVGSFAAAAAGALIWMDAARVLQGLGMGLVVPQVLSTIQATSSGAARKRAIALFAAISGVGTLAGQILSGLLISANLFGLSWRPAMALIGVLAVVDLALLPLVPPTKSAVPLSVDVLSAVVLAVALASLIVSITVFTTGLPVLAGAAGLVLTVIAAAVYWWLQRRSERRGILPLTPPSLFKVPALLIGLAMNLLFFSGYGAFMFEFSSMAQRGLHLSGLDTALAIILFALAFSGVSAYAHVFEAKLGSATMPVGAAVQLLGMAALAVLLIDGPAPVMWPMQIAMIFIGGGQAMMFAPLVGTIMHHIPTWAAGLSGGLFGTMQQLSLSVGVAVLGGLYLGLSRGSGWFSSLAVCLVIQCAAAAVFAVLAIWLARTRSKSSTPAS